ncbi:MAG: hypothetical protein PHU81_05140 [Acidobacteriota bacterium]|nr:hypothetical protein [Acidobacteriota bacterium]
MDVTILREPWKDLLLLAYSSRLPSKKLAGFLLGRKLVQTYLVQKIFVLPGEQVFTPKLFTETEIKERLQVLGLFHFGRPAGLKKNIKQPLFCEKIILSMETKKPAGLKIYCRLVSFDRSFYFIRPDRLLVEMEEENGGSQFRLS